MERSRTFFAAIERGDTVEVQALLAAYPELAEARDETGATALHHAAFAGNRAIVEALLAAGSDVNARDHTHDATPAGWAIHVLRERGALLAIEVEDVLFAIQRGDVDWVTRLVTRHPALTGAADRNGTPLRQYAEASDSEHIRQLFRTPPSADDA